MLLNKLFIIYVYVCVHYIFVQDYDTYSPFKKKLGLLKISHPSSPQVGKLYIITYRIFRLYFLQWI